MNLENAVVGERYKFYLDSSGALTNKASLFVKTATIIGISSQLSITDGHLIIVGWTKDEVGPLSGFYRRNPAYKNGSYNYVDNIDDFIIAVETNSKWEVHDKDDFVPKNYTKNLSINGLNCKRCNDYYQYAAPNQADGVSLICYSCRQRGY